MRVYADLVVGQGEYTAQDGSTKTRWFRVGKILERDNGNLVAKIDALPLTAHDRDGNEVPFTGWVQVFVKDDATRAPAPSKPAAPPTPPRQSGGDDFEDSIPF